MVRTQIQLPEELSREAAEAARRSGVSVAEVVRRSLRLYLDQDPSRIPGVATRQAAAQVAGMFRSGRTDVAERHDDYLVEAYLGSQAES